MYVLGIESSCDETGVALYDSNKGLVGHALHSQIAIHQVHGGVVPELASRDHIQHIVPLVDDVLNQAGINQQALDAIAYTQGPGLQGALLVGAAFAKSLSFALGIPSFGVHHLEAHLMAAMLDDEALAFPFTALLVSGGHTQLLRAEALGEYELIGETLDDAVGEAFDKTAKLMGIDYPGGPKLAALADEASSTEGLPEIAPFPRPMVSRPGCDLSFSGLKTHASLVWEKSAKDDKAKIAIAKAFQDAVVETLCIKVARALKQTGHQSLVVAGGVGANQALRVALKAQCSDKIKLYFPRLAFCTDNGAMVAYTGYLHLAKGSRDPSHAITVHARWPFAEVE